MTSADQLTPTIIGDQIITDVTVNGQSVDLLDAEGNFSLPVTLSPGVNEFVVQSFNDDRLIATETLTLIGDTGEVIDINSADPISQIQSTFRATTFNRGENQLHVGFAAANEDSFAYATDIGAVFDFDNGAVSLVDSSIDGITDAGDDFLLLDDEVADGILSSGETSDFAPLVIDNPLRERFAVDVEYLVAPNRAPLVSSTPDLVAPSDAPYVYEVSAIDFNGDAISFELISGPADLVLTAGAAGTAVLSWTPSADDVGNHQIAILVTDGRGGETIQTYDLLVPSDLNNRPPLITSQLSGTDRVLTVDEVFTYDIEASDPEGETVTLALGDAPAGVVLNGNQLIWTPTVSDFGPVSITIIASDPQGATSTQVINLTVRGNNTAPVFVSEPITEATVGVVYSAFVRATDLEDQVEYSLVDGPEGITINSLTGLLIWSPEAADVDQTFDVIVRATDERGLFTDQAFSVTVTEDNVAPQVSIVVTGPSLSDGVNLVTGIGEPITVTVVANDNVGVDNVVVMVDGQPVALDATTALYSHLLTLGFQWLRLSRLIHWGIRL